MEFTADELWSRVLEATRDRLQGQTYRTWLADTAAVGVTESEAGEQTRFRSTMECRCLGTIMPQRLRDTDEDKKKTSKLGVFLLDPSLRRDRMSCALWIRPERGKRNPPPPGPAADWAAIIRLFRADLHHEPGAPPGPSPRQGFSSPAGFHAFPETVFVHPLPIPWPVCGLHTSSTAFWSSSHGRSFRGRADLEHVNISECESTGQGGGCYRGPSPPVRKIDFSTLGI